MRRVGLVGLAALSAAWGQTPAVSGVTNAVSSLVAAIAPGEELSVYGANLATTTVNNCANSSGFPAACGGTTVKIGGVAAPLVYVSAGQLNIFAPYELYGGTVNLTVTDANGTSAPWALSVAPAAPAISGITNTQGSLISAANLASPSQVLEAFCTGLGITNPAAADGAIPSGAPLAAAPIRVTVGGAAAQVLFAGLVSAGLYQVNFTVPAGLLGSQPVVLTADGIASPPFTLPMVAGTPSAVSIATAANLGTFSLGEVQVGLVASGGTGSYTWSLASGSLPPGLALRGDLPSYVTPFAPTGLIGVATTPGTYNFSLSVTSGASTLTQAFNLKITSLVLRDGPSLPDGFVGTSYYGNGFQLVAVQNGAAVNITCTPATTNGITLTSGCQLSGTPTAAGTQSIQVTFTNGADTLTRVLTWNGYAVQITTSGLLPNATQHAGYTAALAAGGGTGPYTYTLNGALPAGLSLNAGVLSGTPAGAPGKSNFAITVTDSASHSYTRNMALDVVGSPEPLPQIAPYGDLADCTIGMGCTRGIGVLGGGVAPFVWTVSGLPTGIGFRDGVGTSLPYLSPGDLELFGTPTVVGIFSLTVKVTDANGASTTQILPFRISALLADDCVVAAGCSGPPSGTVLTSYGSGLRVVGGTPPYTAVLAPSRDVPAGLPAGLWSAASAISGIPAEGGSFLPLFQFTDSAGTPNSLTIPRGLSINGAAGTSTVIGSYPLQYAVIGQPFSLQLSACCAGNYGWIQAGGTAAPGINLSGTGLLSGAATTAGTYNLLVQAGNGSNYGTRQVTIVETPISMTTGGILPPGIVNASYNQALAAGGGAGSLSWSLAPGNLLPPGLSLGAAGAITGKPSNSGAYSFNVLAADAASHVGFGSFSISVYTACDLQQTGLPNVSNVQRMINQSLGTAPGVTDLNQDNAVNVIDIQIGMNAALGFGCSASL